MQMQEREDIVDTTKNWDALMSAENHDLSKLESVWAGSVGPALSAGPDIYQSDPGLNLPLAYVSCRL